MEWLVRGKPVYPGLLWFQCQECWVVTLTDSQGQVTTAFAMVWN